MSDKPKNANRIETVKISNIDHGLIMARNDSIQFLDILKTEMSVIKVSLTKGRITEAINIGIATIQFLLLNKNPIRLRIDLFW